MDEPQHDQDLPGKGHEPEAQVPSSGAGDARPGFLVLDIADRNPFRTDWDSLDVSDVEAFLTGTTEDEPLHWEAKGGHIGPDHIRRAATAFANREGGYLIVGAERDSGTKAWTLPGVAFPGTEPRTWMSSVIRQSVSPPPDFDIHAWDRDNVLKAAVIRVQPNSGFLSMTQGRVYYRRPGESSFVENGAELQSIHDAVRYRSRALPGGRQPPQRSSRPPALGARVVSVDLEMEREDALRAVESLLTDGKATRISVYISALTVASQSSLRAGDPAAWSDALDRLTEVAGAAITYDPDGDVGPKAIEVIQSLFDSTVNARSGIVSIPRQSLWADLGSRGRALGALAVRLGHWQPLRQLILHEVRDGGSLVWTTWFRFADVWASRSGLYTAHNNVLEGNRTPIRMAASYALRLPGLRPDGVTDEDALITSVCQVDLLTNIAAAYDAMSDGPREGAFPYFAAWDEERVRPIAERLVTDRILRDALLPLDVDDDELADLIRQVAALASQMSQTIGSWGFWFGFVEGKVQTFLESHPPRT